jgi:hypothetical protein
MAFDFNQYMANPMTQIGLGLLGNNQGNYGGFGLQGIGQGLQNTMAVRQQQAEQERLRQMQEMRQQQFDMQRQAFDQTLADRQGVSRAIGSLLGSTQVTGVPSIGTGTAQQGPQDDLEALRVLAQHKPEIYKSILSQRETAKALTTQRYLEKQADDFLQYAEQNDVTPAEFPEYMLPRLQKAYPDYAKSIIDARKKSIETDKELVSMGMDPGSNEAQRAMRQRLGIIPKDWEVMKEAIAVASQITQKSKDKLSGEAGLRKELTGQQRDYKDFNVQYAGLLDSYEQATANKNLKSNVADVALITQFIKMGDPGSTVSSSEAAGVASTRGASSWAQGLYDRVVKGKGLLTQGERDQIRMLAERRRQSYESTNASLLKGYQGIAESAGYDWTRINVVPGVQRETGSVAPSTRKEGEYFLDPLTGWSQ